VAPWQPPAVLLVVVVLQATNNVVASAFKVAVLAFTIVIMCNGQALSQHQCDKECS